MTVSIRQLTSVPLQGLECLCGGNNAQLCRVFAEEVFPVACHQENRFPYDT